MSRFAFSQRSRRRMANIHPDLVAVMELAIARTSIDFTVLEGLRTVDRQRQLVANGASKTMNSRHLTGHAIDIAPLLDGEVSWDWPLYYELEPIVKQAAKDLGVPIEWGGDWSSFKDGPHWQLPWDGYGKTDMAPRARLTTPPSPAPAAEAPTIPFAPAPIASTAPVGATNDPVLTLRHILSITQKALEKLET